MNRFLLIVLLASACGGCAFNRPAIEALATEQQSYYAKLEAQLVKSRVDLKAALDTYADNNRERRRFLLDWRRDLQNADYALHTLGESGGARLLMEKLAEMDLADQADIDSLAALDAERVKVVLAAYDAVIKAVTAATANNVAIVKYLGSDDLSFALRSLDIDGLVRAEAGVRDLRDDLKGIESKTAAEKTKQEQRHRDSLAKARDSILKALEKK